MTQIPPLHSYMPCQPQHDKHAGHDAVALWHGPYLESMTAVCHHFCDMQSVALQNFVENFSEFSAAQRNAGKHVTIMSELSRLVDTRTLMQVRPTLPALPCYTVRDNITIQ